MGWSLCAGHRDGLTGGKSSSCSTRFSYKLLLSLLHLRLPVSLHSVLCPYCHRDGFLTVPVQPPTSNSFGGSFRSRWQTRVVACVESLLMPYVLSKGR